MRYFKHLFLGIAFFMLLSESGEHKITMGMDKINVPELNDLGEVYESRKDAARKFGAKIAKHPERLTTNAIEIFKNFSIFEASLLNSYAQDLGEYFASIALIDICMPRQRKVNCTQQYFLLKNNLISTFHSKSKNFTNFSKQNLSRFNEPVSEILPNRKGLTNQGPSTPNQIIASYNIASKLISTAGVYGLAASKLADAGLMIYTMFTTQNTAEQALAEMIKESHDNLMERIDQAVYVIQEQLQSYFSYIGVLFEDLDIHLNKLEVIYKEGIKLLNDNHLKALREDLLALKLASKFYMPDPTDLESRKYMKQKCALFGPEHAISKYDQFIDENLLESMNGIYSLAAEKRTLVPLCQDLIFLRLMVTQCFSISNWKIEKICKMEALSNVVATKVINRMLNNLNNYDLIQQAQFNDNLLKLIQEKMIQFEVKNLDDHPSHSLKVKCAIEMNQFLSERLEHQYSFAIFVFSEFDQFSAYDNVEEIQMHKVQWIGELTKGKISRLRVVVFYINKDYDVDPPTGFPSPYAFRNNKENELEDLKAHSKEVAGHEMTKNNTCLLGSVLQYVPIEKSRKELNEVCDGILSDRIIFTSGIHGIHVSPSNEKLPQNRLVKTPEILLRFKPFDMLVTYAQARKMFKAWLNGYDMEYIAKIANKTPRRGSILPRIDFLGYKTFDDVLGKEFSTFEVEYRPEIVYMFKLCKGTKPTVKTNDNYEEVCLDRLLKADKMSSEVNRELKKIDGSA